VVLVELKVEVTFKKGFKSGSLDVKFHIYFISVNSICALLEKSLTDHFIFELSQVLRMAVDHLSIHVKEHPPRICNIK